MADNKIIAINTRFLLKDQLEGIGWFTYETVRRIVIDNPTIEFHFLFDRPYDPSFIFASNVKPVVLSPPARHPILWWIWFQWSVKNYIQKLNPNLFISPDGFLPLGLQCPTLLVIHDIAFEHFPSHVPWLVNKYYRHYTKKFAQAATKIATVSTYSKNDIVTSYDIPAEKIQVVYNGANELFRPIETSLQQAVKEEYCGGNDFFLFTGSIHPRKNLHHILIAFEEFKNRQQNDVKLLIVGRKAWHYSEAMDVFDQMKYQQDVIFTGHIQPQALSKIMAGAIALVYTSLFEGFGIPIIEAMQSGTPVITSNCSAMPETAGEAAILVDPTNPKDIMNAMEKIYLNDHERVHKIQLGLENSKNYSWQKTADALWKVAQDIINRSLI